MIEVKHLTKRCGSRAAASDLSLSIEKGVIYGFLGSNGAGESTADSLRGTDQDVDESQDSTTEEGEAPSATEETADETEALWNRIAALSASARTDETPSGSLLLGILVTNANGATLNCEFYPHDVDNYLTVMPDNRNLLVFAADVDALIRALRQ